MNPNLHTYQFDCEIITPMFLAGADGNTPQLRPPSIKGALRFWWRASHGNLPLQKLKERETEIFGGIPDNSSNPNAGKSKIWIRILPLSKPKIGTPSNLPQTSGIQYLYYSVQSLQKRPYLQPGTTFRVLLQSLSLHRDLLQEAANAFVLLSLFGGLGARTRRGAGNFYIQNTNFSIQDTKFPLSPPENTPESLAQYIKTLLSKPPFELSPPPTTPTFSCLNNAKLYLFPPKKNWKEALESIAKPFQEFRRQNVNNIFQTPNFGFPIHHRSKNTTIIAKDFEKQKTLQRRSSPLILKVLKTQTHTFFPLILWLNGEILPPTAKFIEKKNPNNSQNANRAILETFLKTLKDKTEITL